MKSELEQELFFALLVASQQLLEIQNKQAKFTAQLREICRLTNLNSSEKVEQFRRIYPEIFKHMEDQV
jgi:hypothetical protein